MELDGNFPQMADGGHGETPDLRGQPFVPTSPGSIKRSKKWRILMMGMLVGPSLDPSRFLSPKLESPTAAAQLRTRKTPVLFRTKTVRL